MPVLILCLMTTAVLLGLLGLIWSVRTLNSLFATDAWTEDE